MGNFQNDMKNAGRKAVNQYHTSKQYAEQNPDEGFWSRYAYSMGNGNRVIGGIKIAAGIICAIPILYVFFSVIPFAFR